MFLKIYIIAFVMPFLVFQDISVDTGFKCSVQHKPIVKVVGVAYLAELDLGAHEPELVQVIVDGPLAYPQPGGQLIPAAGILLPDEPVHPVEPFYIADY